MRLETLETSGSAGLGAAASKVVDWHSGDGPAANPYPAPSIEGALPLPKILAGAWSPNIVFNPHPHGVAAEARSTRPPLWLDRHQ